MYSMCLMEMIQIFQNLMGAGLLLIIGQTGAPCIKEIPELNDFAKENKNIKVYTFNFDQLEIDELEPIAKKFNILVPSLITHPRDIWGIQTPPAVPATFFINPDGELSLSLFRPQTKDDLNKIIIDLILEYQTRNHT